MEALDKDEQALQKELPRLLASAGKFALVVNESLVGVFDSYDAALGKGYERAGLKPFLVQKISSIPQIQQFTRLAGTECPTSK